MSAKDWYLRQSSRDRLFVLILGTAAVFAMLYLVVVNPLINDLDRKYEITTKNESIVKQMLSYEAQANSLRGSGKTGGRISNKPPYLLIDDIIRKRGMKNPDRVEPIGKTGARVNFSSVEFDKLMLALGELEQYGLKISTMNITRKSSGLVGARFRIDKN